MKRIFLLLGACAFLLSLGVLGWSMTKEPAQPTLTRPLKELLPTGEEFGWHYEDLPLGPTEAIAEASAEKLNLTDWVYRRFTKGPDSFEVYIAYWAPGTMPARRVNEHTPDTCWVGAGWKITDRREGFLVDSILAEGPNAATGRPPPPVESELPSIEYLPGRWRWFEQHSQRINVVFWHILDGEPYQYAHQSFSHRLSQLFLDPFRYRLNLRREQVLVRISSSRALADVWQTDVMNSVLQSLDTSGLLARDFER